MTATVVLTLDTAGPSVVWDAPAGTTAGGSLSVPYVADESLATATLTAGGRTLVLSVEADAVTGIVPLDWPDGPAGIVVTDDVGNAITYTAVLTVASDAIPPIGAVPDRRRRHPRTAHRSIHAEIIVRAASIAGIATNFTSTTPVTSASTATITGRARSASVITAWPVDAVAGIAATTSGLRSRSVAFHRAAYADRSLLDLTSTATISSSRRALARARDDEDLPFLFFDL